MNRGETCKPQPAPYHGRVDAKTVYTDMGPGLELRDERGGVTHLERYGVWQFDPSRRRHQVVDVGDDLQALRAKHGDGPLVPLPRMQEAR